jgi:hypothetical protein
LINRSEKREKKTLSHYKLRKIRGKIVLERGECEEKRGKGGGMWKILTG